MPRWMKRPRLLIIESVLIWDMDDDGQRLQKRESRAWKQRAYVRDVTSTEQQQMLLQWRREARHRTDLIAENQSFHQWIILLLSAKLQNFIIICMGSVW